MTKKSIFERLRIAADPEDEELVEEEDLIPTEEELVEEVIKTPEGNWENYLQAIAYALELRYSTKVTLVNPKLTSEFGAPESGFDIVGHVDFPGGTPLSLIKKYGNGPLQFSAYIAGGKLVQPIFFEAA